MIDEHERILFDWVSDIEAMRATLDDAVIEHVLETWELREALGDPSGSIPARFSVRGVMDFLDS